MQSDEMLVKAAADGNMTALAEIIRRYKDRIYGYCSASLGREDAEDACQETFILAYRSLSKLADPAKLRPWLFAIARNQVRKRLGERRELVALGEVVDSAGDSDDPLFEGLRVSSLARLVRELVSSLSETNRPVVELYYLGSLKAADVADVLGLPPAVVKSRLYEARKDMGRRLVRDLRSTLRQESAPPDLADRILDRCGSGCECGLIIPGKEELPMSGKTKKPTGQTKSEKPKKSCGCGCDGKK